jgi:hypothetical protein
VLLSELQHHGVHGTSQHAPVSAHADIGSSLQTGQYGNDIEMDYIADAAADAYADWRNTWVACLGKPETDESVIKYRDVRSKFYMTLEWYYSKKSDSASPYLTGGKWHAIPLSSPTHMPWHASAILQS